MPTNERPGRRAVLAASVGFAVAAGYVGFAFGHGAAHNPTRHAYLQENGIPAAYRDLLNPLPATPSNLRSGAVLYDENCAVCHGVSGDGLGEGAEGVEPPPPALNTMYAAPMAGMDAQPGLDTHLMHGVAHHHPGQTHAEAMGGVNLDAYMFWAISEGGEAFGSGMPAFAEILDEIERWRIMLYVAHGFADGTGS